MPQVVEPVLLRKARCPDRRLEVVAIEVLVPGGADVRRGEDEVVAAACPLREVHRDLVS
jgi:hypothetical protein